VNVKRVKQEKDAKNRDKVKLTFGTYTDKNGTERNSLQELINALLELTGEGKSGQANLDIRIEMKTSDRGSQFPSAFVMVTEMVPKATGETRFVPKTSRAADVKARSQEIAKAFKG
jgi:hypothetical protein